MAPIAPEVSVIICAYTEERWPDLVAAVTALQHQTLLPDEIILVIDHNPALLELAQKRLSDLPNLRIIENSQTKGLSGARNTGVAAAHGELIGFIDDDATAESDCLMWLTQAFSDPLVLGTGGQLNPAWSGHRPAWLPEEFLWVVGCSYQGLPATTTRVRNPIGGCMCFRREVFDAVGNFQSGIGRVDAIPLGCEETELCIRASQHWPEGVFLYEPRARVHHHVPASRCQWRYFFRRCFAEGVSKALISGLVGAKHSLSAERTYTFRTLPRGIVRGIQDTWIRADLMGLLRAGAIITGLERI
jgi:GT2 family glycosyltransferase